MIVYLLIDIRWIKADNDLKDKNSIDLFLPSSDLMHSVHYKE